MKRAAASLCSFFVRQAKAEGQPLAEKRRAIGGRDRDELEHGAAPRLARASAVREPVTHKARALATQQLCNTVSRGGNGLLVSIGALCDVTVIGRMR